MTAWLIKGLFFFWTSFIHFHSKLQTTYTGRVFKTQFKISTFLLQFVNPHKNMIKVFLFLMFYPIYKTIKWGFNIEAEFTQGANYLRTATAIN